MVALRRKIYGRGSQRKRSLSQNPQTNNLHLKKPQLFFNKYPQSMQIIIATAKIEVKEISDQEFESTVYDNSGILDPKIKGFIRFTSEKDHTTLHQIYVHPNHRREGIGSKMLDALKKKGKIVVFTNTNEGEVFGSFIIKKGFKNVSDKRWE